MNINYDYSGKVVVITGAATGIGKGTALKFAKSGANVVVCDFNEEKGIKTSQECIGLGVKSIFCKVDVTNEEQIMAAKETILKEFGTIDILVNNAGSVPVMTCLVPR
jgi:3-oxoacyl-[acyl-carrier protein] reductase